MPLNARFHAVARTLFHPGMGTEHVGPLLHALVCMRRPDTVVAVGLGYSTLYLLQALADVALERARDARVLAGRLADAGRAGVLWPDARSGLPAACARLWAIDDFSDDGGRLARLSGCVARLGLTPWLSLQRTRHQDWCPPPGLRAGLVWLDCGHQLDYSGLCNRFWPLVDDDGGLMGMHYTHVDVQPLADQPALLVPGPWANAVKCALAHRGAQAGFELLSLVEPHKRRQGSLTLLRKCPDDACRDTPLAQEQAALYGRAGEALAPLDASPAAPS